MKNYITSNKSDEKLVELFTQLGLECTFKEVKALSDDIVEYSDGTKASTEQMAKDVVNFLMWTAEPHLEQRHKFGFRVIIYLIIISVLVYFSMKKIWSRIESKV